MGKTFVKVTAEHNESGQVRPLLLTWADGRKYEIDKITDVRQAPSLKDGGLGIRYTCRIRGKEVYLFCECAEQRVQDIVGAKPTRQGLSRTTGSESLGRAE